MRWLVPLGLALFAALSLNPDAGAHALLRQSDPEDGATLRRAPQAVTITFTEEPEVGLSSVRVIDAAGRLVDQGRVQVVAGQPFALSITLGPLPTGVFTVTWRVVSRVDGHVTGGTMAFGVGASPTEASPAEAITPPPSLLGTAARWALYVGLAGLLGAAWVWTIALPWPPEGALRFLWLAWTVAIIGVIGLAEAQRAEAGVDAASLLRSSLGLALLRRAIPIAGAGVALAGVGLSQGRRRRFALAAAGVCAAVATLTHVAAGHAGAGLGEGRWVSIAVQWAHVAGVGAWIGGLAALLVGLRGAPGDDKATAARRFSSGALIALVVVVTTGIVRAVNEVGAWEQLLRTHFGRLVLLKAGLVLVLAALGAVNRYRSVPAARATLRGLRRVGGAELAVAGVVLAATGFLVGLPPPSLVQEAARPAPPLVGSGSDFATSVQVRLEVAPGFSGPNRFTAGIIDYDTKRPITADRVALRFVFAERTDISPSTLALSRVADGSYQGHGNNLSLDGRWTVVLAIERGVDSVEIPLMVTTRNRPQRIRTIRSPGQPTLYIVELSDQRSIQVYLDPGRPGLNQVHATFFTAAGRELSISTTAAITAARAGDAPAALSVRRFGLGHFVGDAELTAGEWLLDIVATSAEGETLYARVTIRL